MHYLTPQEYAAAVIRYYNKLLYKGYSLQLSPIEQASYYMQDAICRCVEMGTDSEDYCYKQACALVEEYSELPLPRQLFNEMLYFYKVEYLRAYLLSKIDAAIYSQ